MAGVVRLFRKQVLLGGSAFLDRKSFMLALIAAPPAATKLWLFLELRHRLFIGPAGATQVVVMLVAILFKPAPHMPVGLVAAKRSRSH